MPVDRDLPRSIGEALSELFPDATPRLDIPHPAREGPDFVAEVASSAGRLRLFIEFVASHSSGRLRDAAERLRRCPSHGRDGMWALAAEYLSRAQQEQLRNAGVAFFDLAGNAWLSCKGVLVDRRGFANPLAHTRLPRGAFSDKACCWCAP